ncbi:hypothetical protein AKO1_014791 [Acrasis kona]|uniref:Uncharacterized protein n=1 Tax=Acrasis kona TaxID=1008807 RepID=A0AAW2Z349_9EUKA
MCVYKNQQTVDIESIHYGIDMQVVDAVRISKGAANWENIYLYNLKSHSVSLFVEVSTCLEISVALKRVIERKDDKIMLKITRGVVKRSSKQVFMIEVNLNQLRKSN